MEFETIAAIATPQGKGGIAVVRVSGIGAIDVAKQVFMPQNGQLNLDKMPGYRAAFGKLVNDDMEIDEGIALFFREPHSYTGDDTVEFSFHGSEVLAREVLLACFSAGARPAKPGEFTRRALQNGKISLTQAEAVVELIEANSRKSASMAKTALAGALQAKINTVKNMLVNQAAHLCAWIDYPEEDVPPVEMNQMQTALANACGQLEEMASHYRAGEIFRRGVRTAIVGSPNVGKSTLFNLLSGTDRAIVTDLAGTTRDVLREEVEIDGIMFIFSDTAGLHTSNDLVEQEGIKRSYAEIEAADAVVAVFDASEMETEQALQLAKMCKGKPALAVLNKCDLGESFKKSTIEPYFSELITVSAKEETTRGCIEAALKTLVHAEEIRTEDPLFFNARQVTAALHAIAELKDAQNFLICEENYDTSSLCLEEAIRHLSDITGECASEEIITQIFNKFCVGK